jgi:hypothetical protein
MELVIAYLIIEDYIEKDFVFKTVIKLISVFLLINIIFAIKGYDNCGCFGAMIISSPLTSFYKNIFILIGLYYLKYKSNVVRKKIEGVK